MQDNPLQQYFRRPAVYLTLPSKGIGYEEGVLDIPETGEFPIYPMTAIDEITTKTPDALFNGTTVTELIKSCVPNIKDPWKISSDDLDAILVAIRSASSGDTLDLDSTCPKCTNVATYGISLMGILKNIKPGDYSKELEISELKFKLRALTYKEMNEAALGQFEIQRTFALLETIENPEERSKVSKAALESVTLLTMDILSKAIEYIDTPTVRVSETSYILDFLKNSDRNIFNKLKDYNTELKKDTQPKPLKFKCENLECLHEYEQSFTLNPSDFFD